MVTLRSLPSVQTYPLCSNPTTQFKKLFQRMPLNTYLSLAFLPPKYSPHVHVSIWLCMHFWCLPLSKRLVSWWEFATEKCVVGMSILYMTVGDPTEHKNGINSHHSLHKGKHKTVRIFANLGIK